MVLDLGCFHADHAAHFATHGGSPLKVRQLYAQMDASQHWGAQIYWFPVAHQKRPTIDERMINFGSFLDSSFLETSRYTKTLSWGCNVSSLRQCRDVARNMLGCWLANDEKAIPQGLVLINGDQMGAGHYPDASGLDIQVTPKLYIYIIIYVI